MKPAPRQVLWFATEEEAGIYAASRAAAVVEPAFIGDGFVVMVY